MARSAEKDDLSKGYCAGAKGERGFGADEPREAGFDVVCGASGLVGLLFDVIGEPDLGRALNACSLHDLAEVV